MSRRERLRQKREVERRRRETVQQRVEQARDATPAGDDLLQAVVTRKNTIHCEQLGELTLTGLSIGEQAEIRDMALRAYRRKQLQIRIDELKVLKENELLTQEAFDKELQDARDEVSAINYDDLPDMPLEYTRNGQKVSQVVPYDIFYMAATEEGQVGTVLTALRRHHPEVTRRQLEDVLKSDPLFFVDAADVIVDLTKSLIAKKSWRRR